MADPVVKVRFIIKPTSPDRGAQDPTIEEVKNALYTKKLQHSQLLADQVGGLDFQVIEPTETDEKVLDDLEKERELVAALEQQIQQITDRSREQATELYKYAIEEQEQVKAKLSRESERQDEINMKYRDAEEEYKDYAEVRDRCIQVKILEELLLNEDNALWSRLRKITDRITTLDANLQNTMKEVQAAEDERAQQAAQLDWPLERLQANKDAASVAVWKKFTEIGEDDLKLEDTRRRIEKETQTRVRDMLRDAEHSKNAMVSDNEKRKLQLLHLSKTLTVREKSAKLAALRKKKLEHDFNLLKDAVIMHENDESARLNKIRDEVQQLQDELKQKKMGPGQTVEERLASFEKEVKEETAAHWRGEMEKIKQTKMANIAEINARAKDLFKQISATMGEYYSTEFAKIIADYESRRAKQKEYSQFLQQKLQQSDARLSARKAQQAELAEERRKRRAAAKTSKLDHEHQLDELKHNVRQLWRSHSIDTKTIVKFLHRVSRVSPTDGGMVRKVRAEIRRLQIVKDLNEQVTSRELLKAKVQHMKQRGLDAATPKDRLDQLATQLWEATKALEVVNGELRSRIEGYEREFSRSFVVASKPYLPVLDADIADGPMAPEHRLQARPELVAHTHAHMMPRIKTTAELKAEVAHAERGVVVVGDRTTGDHGFEHIRDVDNTLHELGYAEAEPMARRRTKRGSILYATGRT